MAKTIHIDDDVWKALQEKGEAFVDTPNTVIRRLLGLSVSHTADTPTNKEISTDPRVNRVLDKVSSAYEKSNIENRNYALAFKSNGRAVAYLYVQKKQLKLEADKTVVTKLGISDWEHELKGGWWDTADTVYWYAKNGDEKALTKVAGIIVRLSNS